MSDNSSPNLFLFQNYLGEVLKEGKKIIKTAPFDTLDPEALLGPDLTQALDMYHGYFLAAMGHAKTRQLATNNYEKILRQGLFDRQRVPSGLASSVLTACASSGGAGGSTSGSSSLGSASLSGGTQSQSLYVGNLMKAILLFTHQPAAQITLALNYLLEGTRKKHSAMFTAMLQEAYSGLLPKFRQPPMRQMVRGWLQGILDEVEVHFGEEDYRFASRKTEDGKTEMAQYAQSDGFGKFGKCCMCRREASHYTKDVWAPICSIACRNRFTELEQESKLVDHFSLMNWVIECLPAGDQIVAIFLGRELQFAQGRYCLTLDQLLCIIKTVTLQLDNPALTKHLYPALTIIITKWQQMIPLSVTTPKIAVLLDDHFKTSILQMIYHCEQTPISSKGIDAVLCFGELIRNQQIFFHLFDNYDSKFFQPNILGRMLNIISQYAKKEYEGAVRAIHNMLKMLVQRYIERGQRNQGWKLAGQCLRKRQLKRVFALFNTKPKNGIKYLKKLFQPDQPHKKQEKAAGTENIEAEEKIQKSESEEPKQQPEKKSPAKEESAQQPEQRREQLQKSEEREELEEQKQPSLDLEEPTSPCTHSQPISSSISDSPNKSMPIVEMASSELTAADIALILRQNTQIRNLAPDPTWPIPPLQLKQTMVGEYLGTNSQEVRDICKAFLYSFPIQGLHMDQTMRLILNAFSLPKETQQVERIIGDIAHRLVGMYGLQNDTQSYQYFYLLLMVQTTNHNPNVRQNQKLKLDAFLRMCGGMMGREPEQAQSDYQKILENSLNNQLKYNEETLFSKKYLKNLDQHSERLFGQGQIGSESRTLMLYIWQYLVVGLLYPENTKGLFEAVILLGRQGLALEQKGFFEALRKEGRPEDARSAMLRLGMEFGNDLHGQIWDSVVALIFSVQHQNEYSSAVLDKLFTNSATLSAPRLRDFIQSLLLFSGAEFRRDAQYTRELFVLRHINSVLEYNIGRFQEVAGHVWPLLEKYFKDICLHPRKDVAMGGVDSLKQLTLKLIKSRRQPVPHDSLIQTFRYVFQRSGLQMKDLIANVLLNLITPDLRGGWDALYAILDVLDTRDKQLVARILSRLVSEVGLNNLSSLPKLHTICIKELRVCGDNRSLDQLLLRIWELSQHINQPTIWLQTMRSIKDIFKMGLGQELLSVLVRMVNRCLKNGLLEREIYGQVVDLMIFLVEMKGGSRTAEIVTLALEALGAIEPEFIAKYLGGTSGLLSVWQLFFTSPQKLPFAFYLRQHLPSTLLPVLFQQEYTRQLEQLSVWCVNQYYDHLPLELVNLKDPDFSKTLPDLLGQGLEGREESSQLIQFSFSHRDYNEKSALHLVFLDIVQQIYRQLQLRQDQQELRKAIGKIEEATVDSYKIAAKINRSTLLRVFLWNNGFMGGRNLPGLHKQEHRTLCFILSRFPISKSYPLFQKYIQQYITTAQCLLTLLRMERDIKSSQKDERSMIRVYAVDAKFWLEEAKRALCIGFACVRMHLSKENFEGDFMQDSGLSTLINLCLALLQLSVPECLCLQACDTLSLLYPIQSKQQN